MGSKEFLTELSKVRNRFEWQLLVGAGPMMERRTTPRLRIRGTLRNGTEHLWFDAVGAVCFGVTGLVFSEDYWVEAALSIGLPVPDARDVIAASNDMTWRTVDDHREPDPHRQMLRNRLLKAVGLQDSSDAREPAGGRSKTGGSRGK